MPDDEIKYGLVEKLRAEHRFWSYDDAANGVPDDIIIEKTLIYLDLEDIAQLFRLYSFKRVKRVWLERLIPQREYLYSLNRFLAWYYFDVKNPDVYIKAMATRYFNNNFK